MSRWPWANNTARTRSIAASLPRRAALSLPRSALTDDTPPPVALPSGGDNVCKHSSPETFFEGSRGAIFARFATQARYVPVRPMVLSGKAAGRVNGPIRQLRELAIAAARGQDHCDFRPRGPQDCGLSFVRSGLGRNGDETPALAAKIVRIAAGNSGDRCQYHLPAAEAMIAVELAEKGGKLSGNSPENRANAESKTAARKTQADHRRRRRRRCAAVDGISVWSLFPCDHAPLLLWFLGRLQELR